MDARVKPAHDDPGISILIAFIDHPARSSFSR
jgi:hypothetical protein